MPTLVGTMLWIEGATGQTKKKTGKKNSKADLTGRCILLMDSRKNVVGTIKFFGNHLPSE